MEASTAMAAPPPSAEPAAHDPPTAQQLAQLQAATQQLRVARKEYLSAGFVWAALQDVVAAATAAAEPSHRQQRAERAGGLPPAPRGLAADADALASLRSCMQLLDASHRLHLGNGVQPPSMTPFSSSSSLGSGDSSAEQQQQHAALAGSGRHLCGVTREQAVADMKQRYGATLPRHGAVAAPDVEAHLTACLARLTAATADGGGVRSDDDTCDVAAVAAAAPALLARRVAAKVAEVERRRAAVAAATRDALAVMVQLRDAAAAAHASGCAHVTSDLAARLRRDQQKADGLVADSAAQLAKLSALRAEVRAETYTPDANAALATIGRVLDDAAADADATVGQLRAQLTAYDALGPDFAALAARYGRVARELDQTKQYLQQQLALSGEVAAAADGGGEDA